MPNLRHATLLLGLGTLLLLPVSGHAQEAPAPADPSDVIFDAMQAEIDRAMTLRMEGMDAPYHVQAYVSDSASYQVEASFGAITSKGGGKGASISADVRVGSADLDNTNFSGGFSFNFGVGASPPLDPDGDALRRALWLAFDSEYKDAVEAIAKKRAYLTQNNVKELIPDLAPATLVEVMEPRVTLVVDKEAWAETVRQVSAVFREYPFVHRCEASLEASISHQYFVSTDPVRHRFPIESCSVRISAATQADDGMPLDVVYHRASRRPSDLPGRDALVAEAHTLAKRLEALRSAPEAEEYWGPVLFTGEAACRFFLETVGNPLSQPRQPLGSSSGGRLIDRMGRRIASKMVTAVDDPRVKEWEGTPLAGHYPVDDDGVLPQEVRLIDKGFLRTYYMSRVPTKEVTETNGHSRAGDGSTGNLFIRAEESLPREALEKRLLELVADEDLPYGLIVEQTRPGGGFSFGFSRGITFPTPTVLWRLHRDGHREMIRGAAFERASYRVLRDIVALGDTSTVLNTTQFGQNVAVVAPAVLVSELELRRPREEHQKPPYTARPDMTR